MTQDRFKEAMSLLASGVSILTCQDGEKKFAMTISSLSSIGVSPPMVTVCVEGKAAMVSAIRNSRLFGVTILSEAQVDIGIRCSDPQISNEERFNATPHEVINNCPLIKGGLAKIICVLAQEVSVSNNVIFFGQIKHLESSTGKPLVYFHRNWHRLDGANN